MTRFHRLFAFSVAAGLFVLATPACGDDAATGPTPAPELTELALRDSMRALWTDHASWTRLYLISAIADLPDTNAAAARLLRNQDDIGDAIRPFYGDAAGDALTALLHDHITIAAELVTAAKSADTAALAAASARWDANAADIAGFLADANPAWPRGDLEAMMAMHLEQTLAEATARLQGDWAADITAYDDIVEHLLGLADALTDGLVAQFPDKVAAEENPTSEAVQLHLAMRELWADHVTWTRVYLVAAIAGLGDTDAAAGRLLANQDAIGAALVPYYGQEAGDDVAALLRDHILIAADIVTAAKAGDAAAVDTGRARWSENANAIAAYLAAANPAWPRSDLEAMMAMHLEQTLTEATARLETDWVADIASYDEVVEHILAMADVLSAGIAGEGPRAHAHYQR